MLNHGWAIYYMSNRAKPQKWAKVAPLFGTHKRTTYLLAGQQVVTTCLARQAIFYGGGEGSGKYSFCSY